MRRHLCDGLDSVTVVIPAFQEDARTLDHLVSELKKLGFEVIVVDDGSEFPYKNSIKHGANYGYGSALMTGIKNSTRPLIITMDGDGQHSAGDAVNLCIAWRMMEDADMIVGLRRIVGENWHRMWGRKILNSIASLWALYLLPDLNSGMRIFRRDVAVGYAPILCRGFSFTTTLTLSMICDGYRVEFFPIKIKDRKKGRSKVNVIRDGFITLWYILRNGFALRTRKIRAVLRRLRGIHS